MVPKCAWWYHRISKRRVSWGRWWHWCLLCAWGTLGDWWRFFLFSNDRSIIVTHLQQLSDIVPISDVESADLIQGLVVDVKASPTSARESHHELELQDSFVFAAKNFASDALNDIGGFRERPVGLSRREIELLVNASMALSQLQSAAEKFRQTQNTASTKNR